MGDFVLVPLGTKAVAGVVWGIADADSESDVPLEHLKPIIRKLDVRAMSKETRGLVDWLSAYTCSNRGSVLKMAMSVRSALETPPPTIVFEVCGILPKRLTDARYRVIEVLKTKGPLSLAEIVRCAGVSRGVVTGLVKLGVLKATPVQLENRIATPNWNKPGMVLTKKQQGAANHLRTAVRNNDFSVVLLDGVTGSGKTEVYFEAIAETLELGRQVCVLVPEIALTSQLLERFEERFNAPPFAWHSEMAEVTRRKNWRFVSEGVAQVVVGARSALFLPYKDLGLIIIDEEHDQAFKQEDGVCYNARDMAIVRASLGGIPAILVSATPSLESLVNVETGRYERLRLPDRIGAAVLPKIIPIDLRTAGPKRGEWLAPRLKEELAENLLNHEQSLLFLNRRGYAPLTLCRTCGYRIKCTNCTSWMVEHRRLKRLQCHHCGRNISFPKNCPECSSLDSLVACGPGVERILDEVKAFLPNARILLMSSDLVGGPSSISEMIRRVTAREVDVVIGTQLVAKGHNFPGLTLVGVVDADLGLNGGDLRATERTFQLLSQVSGRAGRGSAAGRAFLQTYSPENPVIRALVDGDRAEFLAEEMKARREAQMPPFGRLVALIVSGADQSKVNRTANELARGAPFSDRISVFGPAPAPIYLLRGRYRYRLLMKAGKEINVSQEIHSWLAKIDIPKKVRISIDVDPYTFM